MSIEGILTLIRANGVTVFLAFAAVVILSFLALAISGVNIRHPWRRPMSATERRFRNVFAMMGESRRKELIAINVKKYRCSREAAMKHALEQRDRNARSWR